MKAMAIVLVLFVVFSFAAAMNASDPFWLDQELAKKNYLIAGALITAVACVRYLWISRRNRRPSLPRELAPPPQLPRLTQGLSINLSTTGPLKPNRHEDTTAMARSARELWTNCLPPDEDT
jgi:hypothetical protein